MKKMILTAMVILSLGIVGCGSTQDTEDAVGNDTGSSVLKEEEDTTNDLTAIDVGPKETEAVEGDLNEVAEADKEGNFSVDKAEVKAYAQSIKDAIAAKDMEKFADLIAFPTYISFEENSGDVVETREDFIAFGTDKVFTSDFVDNIAKADIENLEPSRAGFVVTGGNDTHLVNITFGLVNGELGISGITY